jgi:hypothetical protein
VLLRGFLEGHLGRRQVAASESSYGRLLAPGVLPHSTGEDTERAEDILVWWISGTRKLALGLGIAGRLALFLRHRVGTLCFFRVGRFSHRFEIIGPGLC